MDKCKIAETVLTYQTPVFICRVKGCNEIFRYRLDYLMHLTEEHSVKEMLTGLDWTAEDGDIVIRETRLPGGIEYDDVKKMVEKYDLEVAVNKVYFFVEHLETSRDIVSMVKKREGI